MNKPTVNQERQRLEQEAAKERKRLAHEEKERKEFERLKAKFGEN